MNSIAAIFTRDIYRAMHNEADENKLVMIGRGAALTSMVIAILIAKPLLGNFAQAFQFIQEFTGFFTPGIVVIFLLGLFWKKATANSALVAGIGSFVLSIIMRQYWPEIPFIDRVGIVFLFCGALAIVLSYLTSQAHDNNTIVTEKAEYSVDTSFKIGSTVVIAMIAALYVIWW